ncbi:type IX secretion system motor protein PorM/GldM [Marinifilum sp. D737]|uniref:type IX secretion system motor protein PorM/GldM n=1 Tax=Marinifilum sp. D737 TaxID=2969628 RepID=UPI002276692E|nr:gliding motility protein GldM [Marinifilum sp. D737]MCY1634457.1 gliding motility protein GldM [Marinifilum sp. D737]
MGASNCKETPRQRMIGMMYLFLTAMLAINVSNEVLDAFTTIDNGLSKTISTFEEKTQATYLDFDMALQANRNKVEESWDKAQVIKAKSDSLFNFIQELKEKIVEKADGPEYDMKNIKSRDNIDVPGEVMLVGGKGKLLKNEIVSYRTHILNLVEDSTLYHAIQETLDTSKPEKSKKGDPNYSWESKLFNHTPLVGAVTLLSKMQSDIRNTESDIVNYLYNQIEAESFKFNDLKAEVIAKSSYVLKGDTYEAEIFLAAVDTTQNPTIFINGAGKLSDKNFNKEKRGVYRVKANEIGAKTWGGELVFRTPSGREIRKQFKAEYTVAEPNVVVSPTKMNVFYVGVDNPVSVSAPGFTSDRIRASISNKNGRLIKKSDDTYIAKPQVVGRDAKVLVEANFDGEWRPLRTVDFRVKPIPDPVAKIADKSGGKIKKNLLLAQQGVDAVMDNFDFDLTFKITGFTVSTIQKGFTVDEVSRTDTFTPEQIKMFRNLRRNNKVYIEDIRAVGPDGVTRNLPAIVFRIE